MGRFKIENLPKDVKDKISFIQFGDDFIDDVIGLVYLKQGLEFDDGSGCEGFTSRNDLIDMIRNDVYKCEIVNGRFVRA